MAIVPVFAGPPFPKENTQPVNRLQCKHKFTLSWISKLQFCAAAEQKGKVRVSQQLSTHASSSDSRLGWVAAASPSSVPAQPSCHEHCTQGARTRPEATGFLLQFYSNPVTTLGRHQAKTQIHPLEILPGRQLCCSQQVAPRTHLQHLVRNLRNFSNSTLWNLNLYQSVKQVYSGWWGIMSYYIPPFEEQNQPGNISGK